MITKCYFDGSCDENPGGSMGWGFEIRDTCERNGRVARSPGNSNNVAEYMALYFLLCKIIELIDQGAISSHVSIYGDSQLVVQQINRRWKIKSGMYKPWAIKTLEKRDELKLMGVSFSIEWVPRRRNVRADELSKI